MKLSSEGASRAKYVKCPKLNRTANFGYSLNGPISQRLFDCQLCRQRSPHGPMLKASISIEKVSVLDECIDDLSPIIGNKMGQE